jgi:acetylornithine/succinyldiaminopimelate/putrescine aminotransferase
MERGLVIQFGAAAGNVYKFKPPLTTPQADFDRMLEISEEIVAFIQREVDEMRRVPSVAVPATSYQ